uniref:Uncharacterized protein n=1 Tax=Timema genevievae TaxID=629358 RepID=A0A7R9K1E8_TIMGE|nr:unnamed protein product [Timema genevievae]
MVTWWFTTFMAPAIKQKVHNLTGVEFLYSAMSPDQLEIPAFITEYDMSRGYCPVIVRRAGCSSRRMIPERVDKPQQDLPHMHRFLLPVQSMFAMNSFLLAVIYTPSIEGLPFPQPPLPAAPS